MIKTNSLFVFIQKIKKEILFMALPPPLSAKDDKYVI